MKKSVVASVALVTALSSAAVWGVKANADAATHHPGPAQSQHVAKVKKITISSYAYTPGTLKVSPGAKIKIVNKDGGPHSVTSDDGASFDVLVNGRSSTTFTAPVTPGKYKYHCFLHRTMHGLLVVKKI
jgi:plastocyanin